MSGGAPMHREEASERDGAGPDRPAGYRTERPARRVIGRYGDGDGPLLLCLGAVHGNEPAGVVAVRHLLRTLEYHGVNVRGTIVGLTGNLAAYTQNRRFIRRDLNRSWSRRQVRRSRLVAADVDAETREQRQLLEILETLVPGEGREAFVLDLHTTSSASVPFLTLGVTRRSRRFARELPLPLIVGLERFVPGTLVDFLSRKGAVGLVVEAGQHLLHSAASRHEALMWAALLRAGMVEPAAVEFVRPVVDRLKRHTAHLPTTLRVSYRHALRDGDGFRMNPGYANFQLVEEGESLARDARGEIRSPTSGRIFLPLYQRLGDDGFFLVEDAGPVAEREES